MQAHLAGLRETYEAELTALQAAAGNDADLLEAAEQALAADENIVRVEPRRSLWKSEDGFFERLHEGHWVEKTPTGDAHIFDESTRTDTYVEITRTDGGAIVRLYHDRCEFRLVPRDRAFRLHSRGEWH